MHCMHAVRTALCMVCVVCMVCEYCMYCMYCTYCMHAHTRRSRHYLVSNESKIRHEDRTLRQKFDLAESSLTAAIARSRHVAGPESNQEADSSQRDSRRDRSETPGMPTDSRPEIRGIRPFRYGQHALFSSHERPYSASSYQATISRPAGTDCHFRDSLMPPRGGRSTDAHAAIRSQNIFHLIGLGRPRPPRKRTNELR